MELTNGYGYSLKVNQNGNFIFTKQIQVNSHAPCGCSSVGRARRCQRRGRGFEPLHPLQVPMNFPSEQWSLQQCLDFIRHCVNNNDIDIQKLLKAQREDNVLLLHNNFGRWIRNNCGLWKFGVDRVVHDIITKYESGAISPASLVDGTVAYQPYFLSAKEVAELIGCGSDVDHRLSHPDNCSWVIIEIFLAEMQKEHEPNGPPAGRD